MQNDDLVEPTGMTNHVQVVIYIGKRYKDYEEKVVTDRPSTFSLQNKYEVIDCFDRIEIEVVETVDLSELSFYRCHLNQ